MRRFFAKFFSLGTGAILVIAPAAILVWQYQNILDWVKLRNYSPPAAVASLASQDTMTSYARRLLYINHGQIVSNVSSFRQDCPESEQAIVLGCYHSGEDGIYVFDPQNAKLDGLQQVTTAHETLHAAYDRLSKSDKNYIDSLLQNYYQSGLTDPRVKAEISLYQQTEPNDVINEMHSVFGTEVGSLPPALETYYQRYFTNRAAVVAFSNSYESQFTSLQNEINADDAQLASLKADIDSKEASLQTESSQLNAQRASLDQTRSSDPAAYNAQVDSFNAQVDSYNASVRSLQAEIANYNRLVAARNAIAQSLADLDKSIDTRTVPTVTQ